MLPSSWKPNPEAALVRLGGENDGGYFVSRMAVERSTLLISMGLSDDWSFEEDFRTINPVPVLCYDHSVGPRFWIKRALAGSPFRYLAYRRFFQGEVEHRRQMIGYDVEGSVSLKSILAQIDDTSIFLKADIEGAEYRIFDDIVAHAHRFTGITIELHSIDLHRDRIRSLFDALTDFRIDAVHGNNCGGADDNGDPLILEVCLTRREFVDRGTPPKHKPNDPSRPDLPILFEAA